MGKTSKGEWWSGWIQIWYVWYIARTFVNATMYPKYKNKNQKENELMKRIF
jgi:hypothetical protein